ncbi:lipopolysaccharide assembly protein LapA domain-containing protein [Ruegeria sp. Ofav3-42]|uniref:lipopolysaccharide assembly protein LapA domain-containing protein n=1 Tax=Ruegeria sp. Ofav3-42 TaxID=2917759 RepID=UPI001EF6E384|nr:lipopolysaccharide assembly protein LapA domain-containing protein [Ruegeria sp. Ofav3-42]MCG7518642.1 lipopolysaccharide assembly protein LapA domain-containing protein [Ruegeria sp. Ofav3-42]
MRYLRYAFLAVLGIVLVSISLANRQLVELKLMPDALAEMLGVNFATSLPLFVVVLGGVVAGLVIGFLWEWLREHKHRRDASAKTGEVRKLEREVKKLKKKQSEGKDEVLALLDEAS